ncbi:cell wall elongation regulator TseB-like domain-containing protein [Apilactobacillus xinyiensis]|uniref:cell wall elongation regulator TseB-like domain-containing protein n=1 Tax=Apilactobacillus xinyiensis TaxID=2841032 RepID=UPI001C7D89CB|nr:DUF5590 domain-containing protein [Apilactobacillus xinyiensis]
MRREFSRKRKSKKWIKWSILVLIILIGFVIAFFVLADRPIKLAKKDAVSISKKYAKIKHVDDFYVSNLTNTYYTVAGTNNSGESVFVIISKNNGHVLVVNQKDGINKGLAINLVKRNGDVKKIIKASPSIFNDKPVWVVTYFNNKNKLCYETISYKNGKSLQLIANV